MGNEMGNDSESFFSELWRYDHLKIWEMMVDWHWLEQHLMIEPWKFYPCWLAKVWDCTKWFWMRIVTSSNEDINLLSMVVSESDWYIFHSEKFMDSLPPID